MYYNQFEEQSQDLSMSLGFICFFWIILPVMAVVGAYRIIRDFIKE